MNRCMRDNVLNFMNKLQVSAHDKIFELYISEKKIAQRVRTLGKQISDDYRDKNPLFLCVLNGAFVFAADLARAVDIDGEFSFTKLSSYAGLKSSGEVSTILGLDMPVTGRHVIVVEDIVDTGVTMSRFLKQLEKESPASVAIASCFVKSEAVIEQVTVKYQGFDIPNKFIIGYGLDYDGLGRNWKSVYVLKS